MNMQKLLFTSVFLFFYTSVLLIAQSAEPIYVDKSKFNSKGWQLVESGEDGSKIYFYFQNNTYTKAKIVHNSGREEPLELKTHHQTRTVINPKRENQVPQNLKRMVLYPISGQQFVSHILHRRILGFVDQL